MDSESQEPRGDQPGDESRVDRVVDSLTDAISQVVLSGGSGPTATLGSGNQYNVIQQPAALPQVEPESIKAPFDYLPAAGLRGRGEIVRTLVSAVSDDAGERLHVLHGLGGCGKTAVALEVARRVSELGVDVWWISGSEPTVARTSFKQLAFRVGAQPHELAHDAIADVLWRRLEDRNRPWLLVVDN
ncbi:MAG: ATP-binding protein, partial [Actinoplanes sp.]